MKKCFVCKKKLDDFQGDICETCFNFFKEKYGRDFKKHLQRIREYLKWKSDSIKFRRTK